MNLDILSFQKTMTKRQTHICEFDEVLNFNDKVETYSGTLSVIGKHMVLPALFVGMTLSNPNVTLAKEQIFNIDPMQSNTVVTYSCDDVLYYLNREEYYFQKFIEFLEDQIEDNPNFIVPADHIQLDRIAKLIEGVELD